MDYKQFFGLKEPPFRLTPDPDYFFPSDAHREAFQTLLYSIRSGEGFIQITGMPGTGKTLLLRTILRELGDEVSTALILNTHLAPDDLLRVILEDFGLDPTLVENQPKETLLRSFRDFLLEKVQRGVKVVIIVDEAQNLPNATLEELRLLSNLETEKQKLLQIILVGQLELEEKLRSEDLKQLSQRITIRYRLKPLSKNETGGYIYHRLGIAAGGRGDETVRFPNPVLAMIFRISSGTPRLINILCERSLMAAFVEGKKTIEKGHIKKALVSIQGEEVPAGASKQTSSKPVWAFLLAAILLVAGGALAYRYLPDLPYFTAKTGNADTRALDDKLKKMEERLSKKEKDLREKEDLLSDNAERLQRIEASLNATAARLEEEKERPQTENPPVEPDEAPKASATDTPPVGEKPPEASEKSVEQKVVAVLQTPAPAAQPETSETGDTAEEPPEVSEAASGDMPRPFEIPKGSFFITIATDKNQAIIWKGAESGPRSLDQFTFDWTFGNGMFILGKDVEDRPFVFNHQSFFWGGTAVPDPALLRKIPNIKTGQAIPIMAFAARDRIDPDALDKAGEIKKLVSQWSDGWKSMNIDRFINFYGEIFTVYYLHLGKPIVYSKQQLYDIKKDVFKRSGFVSVKISEPVCIIDPSNPNMAVAVFHQNYRSRIYSDIGTKVLYFSRQDDKGRKRDWKIVAKLWLPGG